MDQAKRLLLWHSLAEPDHAVAARWQTTWLCFPVFSDGGSLSGSRYVVFVMAPRYDICVPLE
jgi:hypothetical protein